MQFLSLALLAASALVRAGDSVRGHSNRPSHAWVRDFDNLVAFGDRSVLQPFSLPLSCYSQ